MPPAQTPHSSAQLAIQPRMPMRCSSQRLGYWPSRKPTNSTPAPKPYCEGVKPSSAFIAAAAKLMFARSSELISMKKMQGSASRQRTLAAIRACVIEPPLFILETARVDVTGRMPQNVLRKRLQTISGTLLPPSSHTGLSAALADHVSGARFEQLSPATVRATCRAVLDAIGVMQAASGLAPEVRPFIELARAQRGVPESSVLGTALRTPAASAALANGAMAHALDYEDAFDAAPVHPNASLIPAVLALAQARAPVSGRRAGHRSGGGLRLHLPAGAEPAASSRGRRLVSTPDPRRVRRGGRRGEPARSHAAAGARCLVARAAAEQLSGRDQVQRTVRNPGRARSLSRPGCRDIGAAGGSRRPRFRRTARRQGRLLPAVRGGSVRTRGTVRGAGHPLVHRRS